MRRVEKSGLVTVTFTAREVAEAKRLKSFKPLKIAVSTAPVAKEKAVSRRRPTKKGSSHG